MWVKLYFLFLLMNVGILFAKINTTLDSVSQQITNEIRKTGKGRIALMDFIFGNKITDFSEFVTEELEKKLSLVDWLIVKRREFVKKKLKELKLSSINIFELESDALKELSLVLDVDFLIMGKIRDPGLERDIELYVDIISSETGERLKFLLAEIKKDDEVTKMLVDIYLAPAIPPSPETTTITKKVIIPATASLVNTEIFLNAGDKIVIKVSGSINHGCTDCGSGPNGGWRMCGKYHCGAVVGKINQEGEPFFVGESYETIVSTPGILYLGVWDSKYEDNSGEFVAVVIKKTGSQEIKSTIEQFTITVSCKYAPTGTGVYLKMGDSLVIESAGRSSDDVSSQGPDGRNYSWGDPSKFVLPYANLMALIGKIGERGNWFLIGSNYKGVVKSDGQLYLMMNDRDEESYYRDNKGEYIAKIIVRRLSN